MVSDQFVSRDFFRHLFQIGSLRFKLVGAVASNQAVERKGGEYLLVFNGETLGHLKVVREQEEEDASSYYFNLAENSPGWWGVPEGQVAESDVDME